MGLIKSLTSRIDPILPLINENITLLQNVYDLTYDIQDSGVRINSRVFFTNFKGDVIKEKKYNIHNDVLSRYLQFKPKDGDLIIDASESKMQCLSHRCDWIFSNTLLSDIRSGELVPYTTTFLWSMSIGKYLSDIDSISKKIKDMYYHDCKIYSNSGTGMWILC